MNEARTPDDAHAAILRGRVDGISALTVALSRETGTRRGEAAALSACLWLIDPAHGAPPSIEDAVALRQVIGRAPESARARARLCVAGVRRAMLELDPTLLERFSSELDYAMADLEQEDELRVQALIGRGWRGALSGETDPSEVALEALSKEARDRALPHLVVEANVQLAVVLLTRGDLPSATQVARRASRMARTEALPQEEYLANIVLARIRREAGMPHLATHILGALRRIAPSPWWPIIDWDRVMAGTFVGRMSDALTPVAGRLAGVITAAAGGRRSDMSSTLDQLEHQVRGLVLPERDLSDLRATLDPEAVVTEEGPLAEFLRGERPLPPRGLHGIGLEGSSEPDADAIPALSVGAPAIAGRRVLRPGAGLVRDARLPDLDAGQRRHVRTETALAVLVLHHDELLEEGEFFRQVYEFPFQPRLHRGALEVLLHRVRVALGDLGTLTHQDGQVQLTLASPIRVPDPRSAQPLADRILRTLAVEGPRSAADAARRLGVSVRTVQSALRDLVESGACSTRKEGRSVAYEVEDTTFTEPTLKP